MNNLKTSDWNTELYARKVTSWVKDLLSDKQYKDIESKIMKCSNGLLDSFQEDIKIKTSRNGLKQCVIHVTPSQKYNGFTLLIGLLAPKEQHERSTQLEYKHCGSDYLRPEARPG